MITPDMLMAYVTPIVVLLAAQFTNYQSEKRVARTKQLTEMTAEELKRHTDSAAAEIKRDASEKNEVSEQKLETIHVLVNGNLHEALAELEEARATITRLNAIITALRAELLAAKAPPLPGPAPNPPTA